MLVWVLLHATLLTPISTITFLLLGAQCFTFWHFFGGGACLEVLGAAGAGAHVEVDHCCLWVAAKRIDQFTQ